VWYCNELLRGKILGAPASDHGVKIDNMLYITILITGIVFIITQVLLFWFSYKYQSVIIRRHSFIRTTTGWR
jgi:cytochrome c oxidase subunit 2